MAGVVVALFVGELSVEVELLMVAGAVVLFVLELSVCANKDRQPNIHINAIISVFIKIILIV